MRKVLAIVSVLALAGCVNPMTIMKIEQGVKLSKKICTDFLTLHPDSTDALGKGCRIFLNRPSGTAAE